MSSAPRAPHGNDVHELTVRMPTAVLELLKRKAELHRREIARNPYSDIKRSIPEDLHARFQYSDLVWDLNDEVVLTLELGLGLRTLPDAT